MIFATVGSQKFPFDRLLSALDALQGEDIFAQTGSSTYIPRNYAFAPYLDRAAFTQKLSAAEIVITHGGTGAIMTAVKQGKKVIAVPRLARYGEHVDDHQLQLVSQFAAQNLIFALEDCSELSDAIRRIRGHQFQPYRSSTQAIIRDLETYLERLQ